MPAPTLTRPSEGSSGPLREVGRRPLRWGSLDVLRGLALFMMVAHHFLEWTGGRARDRIVGFEGFAVTDLAAPMFAVGVGAAAYLVGRRIPPWGSGGWARARRTGWRWTQVLLAGLVLDIAVGGGIDGGGVLPTLAVLGAAVTALAAAGVRRHWTWWGMAAASAALVAPAVAVEGGGFFTELLNGPFSLAVYGVFAAAGAAVAGHALAAGGGEERLPLLRATLGTLVVGTVVGWLAPAAMAAEGLWPPDRHPGDLAFTTWGLVGTFALWGLVRRLLPAGSVAGAALARAGRRTLLLFVGHYVVKLALQHSDLLGTLDTWRWGLAAWVGAAAVCALATVPRRGEPAAAPARAGV